MARVNSVNFSGLEKYVVDSAHPDAPFSTVQAAVTAAAATALPSVVYILPGVYAEDVTLPADISLCALGTSGQSELVKITGRCLLDSTASAINTTISGITFQTTAPFPAIDIQGASPVSVQFIQCAFSGTLNTAVSVASSGTLDFRGCKFTASTLQKIWDVTGASNINCYDSIFSSVDTESTVNNSSARMNIFNSTSWVDSFDITAGTVALRGSIADPTPTFPAATLASPAAIFAMIDTATTTVTPTSGFLCDGSGIFVHSNLRLPGALAYNYIPLDPLLIVVNLNSLNLYFNPVTQNTSTTMKVYESYLVTSGTPSLALPTGARAGSQIKVSMMGGTSWTITQGAGQSIRLGSSVTTVGAGGSLASTADGDCVTLDCVDAGLSWVVSSVMGSITVV